jgi:pyridoxal 5'-phosphate synthase pdxS subunit
MRAVVGGIKRLTQLDAGELMAAAKELGAPFEIVKQVAETGRLPVPNFSAGGVATPADAALMRMLGAEAVFVGSGIFKSSDPGRMAKAIVESVTHWEDAGRLAQISKGLGKAMRGLDMAEIPEDQILQTRGW